jgi:hypothetical protein
MSFPLIVSSAVTSGSTATTSASVNLPTGILNGDLLMAIIRNAAGGTIAWPNEGTDWIQTFEGTGDASDDTTGIAFRQADGSEGASITVTFGTSGKFAAVVLLIRNAERLSVSTPSASPAIGTSVNPDSPLHTPAGGAKDFLWLSVAGYEGEQTSPPTYPSGATHHQVTANSGTADAVTTNCQVAVAAAQSNAASLNPGAYTISASDDWTALTISVFPRVEVSAAFIGPGAAGGNQGFVLFAPTVKYVAVGATIGSGSALFAPTVLAEQQVTSGTIASGSVLFSPTVKYRVASGTIASGNQRFAPTVKYKVVGGTRAAATQLFAPSTRYKVAAAFIASTLVLSPPTVSPGAVSVTNGTIASTLQIFAPTTKYRVVTASIPSGNTLFAPRTFIGVGGGFIPSGTLLSAPTIQPGAVQVTAANIPSGSALFSPAVRYRISGSSIPSGSVLFVPRVVYKATGAFIPSSSLLFVPTIRAVVATATIPSGSATFAPTVRQKISLASIPSGTVLFSPTVLYRVSTSFIPAGSSTFAPSVRYVVSVSNIPSGNVLFGPRVNRLEISAGFISSTTQLFAPRVGPDYVQIVSATLASAGTVDVVLTQADTVDPTLGG